jgi:hypothetical protein
MGALVYVGTFVAGNSFDYRLVCLLLTLPYLLRWPLHRGGAEPATLPRVAAAVVLVQLWVGTLSEQLRLLDELVSWTLAGMLVVLLARSAPSAAAVLRGRASADSQGGPPE